MSNAALAHPNTQPYESTGGRLVTTDGRALPLVGAAVVADAKGGVVRVTLEQTFKNPWDEPLTVTYQLPLPAEGAVSGFAFRVGDKRVVGEVDTKKKARQRFEDAVLEGRTAALLDQERSSLFTQEVGNVPPRAEVVCEVTIDQKITWLSDGCWEWRFPTVVAPRYLGEPSRVADAAKVTVDVADRALPVKLTLALAIRDRIPEGARPESPSHTLHTARGLNRLDVTFGDERGVGLDRDVVVRWKTAELSVGASFDVARPASGRIADAAYGLVTLVPPLPEARMAALPRDLIVLLDTSGSMSGEPLDQARRITSALVDSLGEKDQLELIEFSWAPRRWKSGPVPATDKMRREALSWLSKLRANGGTEMKSGILEALSPLRPDAQRQVILVTDGLIGSEHEVLEAISQRLPRGSRVHTVGVGSAVNRSLTMPAARAGRGVELVVGLGEDVERALGRIVARTTAPLVTEVEVSGSAVELCAPLRVPDLFGGAPAMLSLKLRPEGGEVVVRGRTAQGLYEQRLQMRPVAHGEGNAAVTTLFARELVEDLELNLSTGADKRETDALVERLGLDYQISTRLTSWVAVSQEVTVDPRAPKRKETMPQNLAHGLSAEGLGLRQPMTAAPMQATKTMAGAISGEVFGLLAGAGIGGRAAGRVKGAPPPASRAAPSAPRKTEEAPAEYERKRAEAPADELREDGEADDASRVAFDEEPADAPAAPPASKAKDSLLSRVAKKVFGPPAEKPKPVSDAGEARRDEGARAPAPSAAPQPAPHRRIAARLVTLKDGRMAVELTVDGRALTWAPASDAQIELADGRLVKATVDTARTTADGTYGPGLTVVLALQLPGEVGTPVKVHLACGGEVLEISL